MKAITLHQPWASAMAWGCKKIETRPRRINYRGDLAIHASKRPMTALGRQVLVTMGWPIELIHFGYILGICNLYDCVRVEDRPVEKGTPEWLLGDYSSGRFAWLTRDMVRVNPIPCRGFQATPWTVPKTIEDLVNKQLETKHE